MVNFQIIYLFIIGASANLKVETSSPSSKMSKNSVIPKTTTKRSSSSNDKRGSSVNLNHGNVSTVNRDLLPDTYVREKKLPQLTERLSILNFNSKLSNLNFKSITNKFNKKKFDKFFQSITHRSASSQRPTPGNNN